MAGTLTCDNEKKLNMDKSNSIIKKLDASPSVILKSLKIANKSRRKKINTRGFYGAKCRCQNTRLLQPGPND